MKKIALTTWTILSVLIILLLFVGIKYYNFLSFRASLVVFGISIAIYFFTPILFKKPSRLKIRIIENLCVSGLFLLILIALSIGSPGNPNQFRDSSNEIIANSISEWDKVKIGGVDQWLLIKGENKINPVVLYLTGGFGVSSFFYAPKQYPQFEKDFTVVYWEQRGSGKSYSDSITEETLTFEQLTSDINEISIYLRTKFNKRKILLVGHSWGTSIGLLACKRYPENFQFFIGVGQSVNFEENITAKYFQLSDKAEKEENIDALRELKSIGEPPYNRSDYSWKDNILNKWADYYSGSKLTKNWFHLHYWYLLNCPEYTVIEKIKVKSQNKLFHMVDDFQSLNFYNSAVDFSIPIYFVQGENDLTSTTSVVLKYYNTISAPDKGVLVIKNSGHDPQWDHSKEFHSFLLSKCKAID